MRHESTALIAGLFILAGGSQAGCSQAPQLRSGAAILETAADSVHLRLVDAASTRLIPNADVEIHSSNGIICARSPCPTNEKRWTGRTDSEGSVRAPVDALQVATSIGTPEHYANLIKDSHEAGDGAWIVEMMPRKAPAHLEFHPLDLKLIDAASLRPIAYTPVRVVSGGEIVFEATTNALGYIFLPVEALLGDSTVALGTRPTDGQIIVAGYQSVHTDFARANRKVLMQRR